MLIKLAGKVGTVLRPRFEQSMLLDVYRQRPTVPQAFWRSQPPHSLLTASSQPPHSLLTDSSENSLPLGQIDALPKMLQRHNSLRLAMQQAGAKNGPSWKKGGLF